MAESAQIARTSKPWHEALAEFFILYPERTMTEAAKHFGVTLPWLSVVKNSDAFQDYYQARRREHFNEVSKALADSKIEDKLKGLADMSLDAISERVAEHIEKVPTRELSLDALHASAQLALKALGFSDKRVAAAPGNFTQNNTTVIVGAEALARAKGNLRVVRERIIDPALEAARQPQEPEKEVNGPAELDGSNSSRAALSAAA